MRTAARPAKNALRPTRLATAIAAMTSGLLATGAWAAPVIGSGGVTSGSAAIAQNGAVTNIHQSSHKASINWQSFSTAPTETVNFHQPNAASVTLNRVIGNEQSVLQGALNANGQVFLLNSNGVLIGKGASVNTAGFVASTLGLSDADFNSGNYRFSAHGNAGALVNLGTITVADQGYAALLGQQVKNEGVIVANQGTVSLTSGDRVTLNFNGDSFVNVTIDQGALSALVENKHAIIADGGQILLTAKAATALLESQVNNTGILQAQTLTDITGGQHSGKIELFAYGGTASVAGTLDASAPHAGNGGFIETSGDVVKIADTATITTLAQNGRTGTWLIDPTDFTIAAGGDMTGAALSNTLSQNNVTIESAKGSKAGKGDIVINDKVTWNADTTLALDADNDIHINNAMTIGGKNAQLVMTTGENGDYHIRTKASYSGAVLDANGKPVAKQDTSGGIYGSVTFTDMDNKDGLVINGVRYRLIHTMEEFDALDGADSVTNTFVDGMSIYAKQTEAIPFITLETRTVIGGSSGAFYDFATDDFTIPASITNGTCGSGNCYYNPETRSYDLKTSYFSSTTIAKRIIRYYADVDGKFTISSYDAALDRHYNPITKNHDLIQRYPDTNYRIYRNPDTGEFTQYTHNGEKYYDPSSNTYSLDRDYSGQLSYNSITKQYDKYSIIYDNGTPLYHHPNTDTYETTRSPTYFYNPATGRFDLSVHYATTSGHFSLAQDLRAGEIIYNSAPVHILSGSLIGMGHVVDNLTIHAPDLEQVALIGETKQGGFIRDLGVVNVNISGKNDVGALVGNNNSDLNHVYSSGTITAPRNAGGLFGSHTQGIIHISNSFSEVEINAGIQSGGIGGFVRNINVSNTHATGQIETVVGNGGSLGGLFGYMNGANISSSYATGNIAGRDRSSGIGGLVGAIQSSNFMNVFASGDATGGYSIGGLIGETNLNLSDGFSVVNSHAYGHVTGIYPDVLPIQGIGGLIGKISSSSSHPGTIVIDHSSAKGNVTSNGNLGYLGGLVGLFQGAGKSSVISNSWATGDVISSVKSPPDHMDDVGGLVGLISNASIISSYATGNVSGTSRVGGLVGQAAVYNIENSYATGNVAGLANPYDGTKYVGSLLGTVSGISINNNYWKQQEGMDGIGYISPTSSLVVNASQGLTDAQLPDIQFYADGTIESVLSARVETAALQVRTRTTGQIMGSLITQAEQILASTELIGKQVFSSDLIPQVVVGTNPQEFFSSIKSIDAEGEQYNLREE